jgi:hypothetical protein
MIIEFLGDLSRGDRAFVKLFLFNNNVAGVFANDVADMLVELDGIFDANLQIYL